jgi:hypothetical protein
MSCALILVVLALAAAVGAHGMRDLKGPAAVAALSQDNAHHAGHHAAAGTVTDDRSAVGAPVCRAVCLAVAIAISPLDLPRRVSGGALLTALPDKALPRSRTRLPPLRPPMDRA